MELIALAAAAALTYRLARKLSGDPYAAAISAALYVFSPVVRVLASTDARLAASTALLPLLFLRFYRITEMERGGDAVERRLVLFLNAVVLAAAGATDPRFAVAAAAVVWLVILLGLFMDRRRKWEVWSTPVLGWLWTTLCAILLYAPLWWARRLRPGYAGGPLAGVLPAGADFAALWEPSPAYTGMAACALALAGLNLSRSYRAQARLWFFFSTVMLWLALGPRFLINGRYLWWAPVLGRGTQKIPLLSGVDPAFYAAAGQLGLAFLAAYGFTALLARVDPAKARWTRPAAAAAVILLLAGDFLR